MRVIKKFNSFKLNENIEAPVDTKYKYQDLTGEVTLYRLTSHPVVDLSEPGEYYVCDQADVNPDLLDRPGSEMYLITVTCGSDNIDTAKSQQECDEKGINSIVAVKDDSKCKVVSANSWNR